MKNKKIPIEEMRKCIDSGLGIRGTALKLGVSPGGVSKAIKKQKISMITGTTKNVVLARAGEFVAKEINAMDQLYKINGYANELLDLLMRWAKGDEEALKELESQYQKFGKAEHLKQFRLKDPKELAFKAMGEIREQLKLHFEMMKALYDMENIAAFQEEILTTIAEVSPDVRKKIVEKLQQRRIIRSVVK
jgi:hypothetical protein